MASAEFKEEEKIAIDFTDIMKEINDRLGITLDTNLCSVILTDNTQKSISLPRVRLTQIIENLVSNGIKYRDQDKQQAFVKVKATNDEDHLYITVEDNGQGIPDKYKGYVFDMFKRFHPQSEPGSGLGLNIVLKHIEALNGNIDLKSTEKQGTVFTIKIPFIQ
jgi:signal transduction histidine kinase